MKYENLMIMNFNYNNTPYKIKGLEIMRFEIKNQCSSINYLSSFAWNSNRWETIKHQITLRLQGGYYQDNTQSSLLKIACMRASFQTKLLMPTQQKISGNFIITEYEIITDYDESARFQIEMVSAGECVIE